MGKISQGSILLIVDMVSLYLSIPHIVSLKAFKDALDCWQNKKSATDILAKKAEFVLTDNYFGLKYSKNILKWPLVQNFQHLMRIFLWMSLRRVF